MLSIFRLLITDLQFSTRLQRNLSSVHYDYHLFTSYILNKMRTIRFCLIHVIQDNNLGMSLDSLAACSIIPHI